MNGWTQVSIPALRPSPCGVSSVRAAVSASGVASFLSLSAGDVYSSYVGEAEAAVRRSFALARQVGNI